MKQLPRISIGMALMGAAIFFVASSASTPGTGNGLFGAVASAQSQPSADQPPPDPGPDPAAVNQAPIQDQPSGQSYTTQAPPSPDQAGAPDQYGASGQAGAPGQGPDDQNYAEQPTQQTDQAPPPLPDYDQPPAPGDDYAWTPGYWAWGPAGYYWVPGVWVEPPYVGALWTPGYWGFYGGRYLFYPGYWGLHIGFYGGINYGFGYVGFGYEGGYWNGGHFFYNRVYNNINVRSVHNVYSYRANVRVTNNVRVNNVARPSYRGGPSGVQSRPQPAEGAAWREPYAPRMSTQVQHEQNYSAVHGQYASENNGRPASPAVSHALPADRNVHPQPHSSGGSGGEHHR
jgi:WXXGXW repeat (2 copies)